jgi:putative transposase
MIDLSSHRVVVLSVDRRMKIVLEIRALMMAINLRKPPPGLVHHSDRSSQYASLAYQALLKQHGMICSMGRKGKRWDNALVGRFFTIPKREWTGDGCIRTQQTTIADVRNMWRCITPQSTRTQC